MSDFKTQEEAFAVVDSMCKTNAVEFNYAVEKVDDPIPLLVKFRYYIGHGTKRSWESTDHTSVVGEFEPKSKKAMEDFNEGIKFLTAGAQDSAPGGVKVKIESPNYEKLKAATSELRSHMT